MYNVQTWCSRCLHRSGYRLTDLPAAAAVVSKAPSITRDILILNPSPLLPIRVPNPTLCCTTRNLNPEAVES